MDKSKYGQIIMLIESYNGAMESINGWLKEELFNDFKIKEKEDPIKCIEEYITFFNEQRPSYSLNYLTPKQFKDIFTP